MKKKLILGILILCFVTIICNAQTQNEGQRLVGTWNVENGSNWVGDAFIFRADGTYSITSNTSPQTGYWGIGPFENLGGNIYFMTDRTVNNRNMPTLWFYSISPNGNFLHMVREGSNGIQILLLRKR